MRISLSSDPDGLSSSPRTVDDWVAYTRKEMATIWSSGQFHQTVWEFTHFFTVDHRRARRLQSCLTGAGYRTGIYRQWSTAHLHAVQRRTLEPRDLSGGRAAFEALLTISAQLDAQYHGWDSNVVGPRP